MNSPKISESLNRFFTVTNADSDFAANDVINMRGGEAAKAGTFHKWNIFRRAGRSDDEIRANNNTRQQFLNALKESFGLEETGKALVDKLATILGKDVFKPEDYTFGKDGRLNCGKPLTTRRITDVYEAVTGKIGSKLSDIADKGSVNAILLNDKVKAGIYNAIACLPKGDFEGEDISSRYIPLRKDFEKVLTLTSLYESGVNTNMFKVPSNLLSVSARLRIASGKFLAISDPEQQKRLSNDLINRMKQDVDFDKDLYEKQESLIDEWYAAKGWDRQEVENRIVEYALRPNPNIENDD